jgi:putative peptidoglycan binding protein
MHSVLPKTPHRRLVSVLLALFLPVLVVTGTAAPSTAAASAGSSYIVLRPGDHGAKVQALQRYLHVRPVSGIFGPRTRKAVIRWQAAHHRTRTGLVGKRLWRAVVASGAAKPAAARPSATTPASTPASKPAAARGTAPKLRSTKPTGSNVGAGVVGSTPTKLATSADGTWSNGVLTIRKSLRNRVVRGTVRVAASNLTIENNIILGDAGHKPSGTRFVVDTGGGTTGTVVRFNDLRPTFTSSHFNGIGPRNVVAEYNDISHVVDGFVPHPRGSNNVHMVIRGNYVHGFQFVAPASGHGATPLTTAGGIRILGKWAGKPWTHGDAVQVEVDGTTGLNIYGNNFVATWARDVGTLPLPNAIKELSCFMLNGGRGLVIEDNWLDGGEYAVNNADRNVTGSFARNKFGRAMAHKGTGDKAYFALMIASAKLATHDGTRDQNVWQDSGKRVPRRSNR